nr:VOC family protein [Streptomyces scabichelini]
MTAAFRPITHLRHVGIGVPDYGKALEFYKNIWGLQPVADDSGVTFFATPADPEQYVLRVRQDQDKRLDLIAFGVNSPEEVDELARRLAAGGSLSTGSPTSWTPRAADTATGSSTPTADSSRCPPASRRSPSGSSRNANPSRRSSATW